MGNDIIGNDGNEQIISNFVMNTVIMCVCLSMCVSRLQMPNWRIAGRWDSLAMNTYNSAIRGACYCGIVLFIAFPLVDDL